MENIVTKKERLLGITLFFAVILVIILVLVTLNTIPIEELKGFSLPIALIICTIMYINSRKRKSMISYKTDEEIVQIVKDSYYKTQGITLNSEYSNVDIQRGNVGEAYINFLDLQLTVKYQEGIGPIERYNGKNIRSIKKDQGKDEMHMMMAKRLLKASPYGDLLDELAEGQE